MPAGFFAQVLCSQLERSFSIITWPKYLYPFAPEQTKSLTGSDLGFAKKPRSL